MSSKLYEVAIRDASSEIVEKIVAEDDPEELERLAKMFQKNRIKREFVRSDKIQGIVERLYEEMDERLRDDPSSISNKDMVSLLSSTTNALNSISQKTTAAPAMIQINQQVNIGEEEFEGLNSSSRKNIQSIIDQILMGSGGSSDEIPDGVIDALFEEVEK